MRGRFRGAKFLDNFPLQKLRFRKAVFALVYSKTKGKIKYLLLKRKKHWVGWEFPKGGIEFLETKRMAVRREVKEETGLKILKIKKFDIKGLYHYHKKFLDRKGFIGQTYILYAVEAKHGKAKIDRREHSKYEWAYFEKAIKKLTWENQKKSLEIIDRWIRSQ